MAKKPQRKRSASRAPGAVKAGTPRGKGMPAPGKVNGAGGYVNSLGAEFKRVKGLRGVFFSKFQLRVKDFREFVEDEELNGGYDYRRGLKPVVLNHPAGGEKHGWKYTWASPGFEQTDDHPVTCVSWEDANAFCAWLTRKERLAGRIGAREQYRLPTDLEWSLAVGLPGGRKSILKLKDGKLQGIYPWDGGKGGWPPPDGAGNYAGDEVVGKGWPIPEGDSMEGYRDDYPCTSPVGSFAANANGLYDLGGNVWEWCDDRYRPGVCHRVLRGASWCDNAVWELCSSFPGYDVPETRRNWYGFRVVLSSAGKVRSREAPQGGFRDCWESLPVKIKAKPARGDAFRQRQAIRPGWRPEREEIPGGRLNCLGMGLVPVKGLPGVLFSMYLTRVKDFREFVQDKLAGNEWFRRVLPRKDYPFELWSDPGFEQTDECPVVRVSWYDAKRFCRWLTQKDRKMGLIGPSERYRLPEDWEWSKAVGLREPRQGGPLDKCYGNKKAYPWDGGRGTWPPPADAGNYAGEESRKEHESYLEGYNDGYPKTSPVGSFPPNANRLYDLGGNVWEWCEDWVRGKILPDGESDPEVYRAWQSRTRVCRGAGWRDCHPARLLSSARYFTDGDSRFDSDIGFRVVLVSSTRRTSE